MQRWRCLVTGLSARLISEEPFCRRRVVEDTKPGTNDARRERREREKEKGAQMKFFFPSPYQFLALLSLSLSSEQKGGFCQPRRGKRGEGGRNLHRGRIGLTSVRTHTAPRVDFPPSLAAGLKVHTHDTQRVTHFQL